MKTEKSVSLYYKNGSSDKVYQASVEQTGGGYVVNFAFGRRGATLATGSKTQEPVGLTRALEVFEKLVAEKQAKGYTPGEDGTPYRAMSAEQQATGILPQLCNEGTAELVDRLLGDIGYVAQEKLDGKRVLLRKDGDVITGINRKGLECGIPDTVRDAAVLLPVEQAVLDGECIGDRYYAFDLLLVDGTDGGRTVRERSLVLECLLIDSRQSAITLVESAVTRDGKAQLLTELFARKREGIVFKRADGRYKPGRPASGGDWIKHKFTTTGSFVVSKVNQKRSVEVSVFAGKSSVHHKAADLQRVGNVSVPVNQEIPKVGSIVEIKYLYAFRGGSLFQPVLLGTRDDLDLHDCKVSQLKYKSANEESEEP